MVCSDKDEAQIPRTQELGATERDVRSRDKETGIVIFNHIAHRPLQRAAIELSSLSEDFNARHSCNIGF